MSDYEKELPQTPNTGFRAALILNENLFIALDSLQSIDEQVLSEYLMSEMGQKEVQVLLKDLVYFDAKVDKSFMRGLCVGIACSVIDYEKHKAGGEGVIPTLRAGLALLRNTNTNVITGLELGT